MRMSVFTVAISLLAPAAPAVALEPGELLPHGNYYLTCQRCEYDLGVLTCACRRINGTWKYTRLNYARQCPGDTLQNINGNLACD